MTTNHIVIPPVFSRTVVNLLVAAVLFSGILTTHAVGQEVDTARIDTTGTIPAPGDTTGLAADSVQRIVPIPFVGSIEHSLSPQDVITDTMVNFLDYAYPGDLLRLQQGVFVRDLGGIGQNHGLTIQGIGPQATAMLADGIPLQEPMSGTFDLNLYPVEHLSRLEFITGTRAFYYAFNGTGGTVNFLTKSKRAIHPFSRIRYTEGAYGFSTFDGMVSQDIIRGLNVTAGFQHTASSGRFLWFINQSVNRPASNYDAWNGRIKIRYNISSRVNIFASEMYNQTRLGLFGGIVDTVPYISRFDRIRATVVNTDTYEKITRHDVQAGLTARLLGDSTLISNLVFYHSTSLREFRDGEFTAFLTGNVTRHDHRSQWFGTRLTHTFIFGRQQVDAGAELERRGLIASPVTGRRLDTRTSVFGKTQSSLLHPVNIAAYVRFDNVGDRGGLSFGTDAGLAPDSLFEIFGGFSHAYRFPTFLERYWQDSVIAADNSGQPEQHDLIEAGIRTYHPSSLSGEVKLFHRTVHDAYALFPGDSSFGSRYRLRTVSQKTVQGISATFSFRYGVFLAEGAGQYLRDTDSSEHALPRLSGTGGLYFWSSLFRENLILKAGVRGRFFTSYQAPGYDVATQRFLPNTGEGAQTVGIMDIVLIASIGDAHLHFIFDNFLNRRYIISSFYPMSDRQTRFGVAWDFLD